MNSCYYFSITLKSYTRAELSKELSSKICVIKLNYKPITEAHSLKLKKFETVKILPQCPGCGSVRPSNRSAALKDEHIIKCSA